MSGPDGKYLGDGVYASFDGWFVWLTVDRNGVKERVALEPEVYAALRRYARDVWPDIEESTQWRHDNWAITCDPNPAFVACPTCGQAMRTCGDPAEGDGCGVDRCYQCQPAGTQPCDHK